MADLVTPTGEGETCAVAGSPGRLLDNAGELAYMLVYKWIQGAEHCLGQSHTCQLSQIWHKPPTLQKRVTTSPG